MGASGWEYFTPYRADISQALEELRRRIFQSRNYGDPLLTQDGLISLDAILKNATAEDRPGIEAYFASNAAAIEAFAAERKNRPEPKTIEEALEQAGTEGTHSILDIFGGISDGPGFGTAFPMPQDLQLELYGTTQPTRSQVEAKIQGRGDDLDRYQCWYVIVYKDGRPDEIYFEGCSGD